MSDTQHLERQGSRHTPISDPFGAAHDPEMSFLARALDPIGMGRRLALGLPRLVPEGGQVEVRAIHVRRYKPGRRCLIEYQLEVRPPGAPPQPTSVLAKARAKGADELAYGVMDSLWNAGFRSDSADGVSVPEPIGILPDLNMGLARKVAGITATELLKGPQAVALAARIAEAAHKLHQACIPTGRRHGIADELRILHERLSQVASIRPQLSERLGLVLDACDQLGGAIPELRTTGIHRDFYSDNVIVDDRRLYLLDLDLFCEGDPGLDIGNFIGHMIEQALRSRGDPAALQDAEEALEERYFELAGEERRPSVQAYTTLTLVRHIYLSTQFSDRRHLTDALLDLCAQRLGVATHTHHRARREERPWDGDRGHRR